MIIRSYTVLLWEKLKIYCEARVVKLNTGLILENPLDHISRRWRKLYKNTSWFVWDKIGSEFI